MFPFNVHESPFPTSEPSPFRSKSHSIYIPSKSVNSKRPIESPEKAIARKRERVETAGIPWNWEFRQLMSHWLQSTLKIGATFPLAAAIRCAHRERFSPATLFPNFSRIAARFQARLSLLSSCTGIRGEWFRNLKTPRKGHRKHFHDGSRWATIAVSQITNVVTGITGEQSRTRVWNYRETARGRFVLKQLKSRDWNRVRF